MPGEVSNVLEVMIAASDAPSRALNAGSTLPPLAINTALTTLASMSGKASIKVFSAWTCGLEGRGGFAGGSSSSAKLTLGFGEGLFTAFAGVVVLLSCVSSSKSSSSLVVADSPYNSVNNQLVISNHGCIRTGFSVCGSSDMLVVTILRSGMLLIHRSRRQNNLELIAA